jgi:hypothetical protein
MSVALLLATEQRAFETDTKCQERPKCAATNRILSITRIVYLSVGYASCASAGEAGGRPVPKAARSHAYRVLGKPVAGQIEPQRTAPPLSFGIPICPATAAKTGR